jgi:hypothetical protein
MRNSNLKEFFDFDRRKESFRPGVPNLGSFHKMNITFFLTSKNHYKGVSFNFEKFLKIHVHCDASILVLNV